MFKKTFLAIFIYLIVSISVETVGNENYVNKNNLQLTKNDEFFASFVDDSKEAETKNIKISKNIKNTSKSATKKAVNKTANGRQNKKQVAQKNKQNLKRIKTKPTQKKIKNNSSNNSKNNKNLKIKNGKKKQSNNQNLEQDSDTNINSKDDSNKTNSIKKNEESEISVNDLITKEEELPLKLYNLIDLALERNLQTRQAYLNVKLSKYDLMIARSNFYPSITGSGNFSAVDGDRYYETKKNISGDISLRYSIFAFGKYMFNVNAVKHSLKAVKYEEDQKIQDIIFEVVENYYNLLSLKAEKDAVVADRDLSYETYKAASLKYKLGLVPLVDKLKANTAYSQRRVDVIKIENEIKKQEANLNIVLNLEPDYILYVENPEINVKKTNKNVDFFLNEAKVNRADLKSLREIKRQKEQELNQAKTEFLPEVSISGSAGIGRDVSNGSNKRNIKEESITLGVSIPIFDGFSDIARVKKKSSEIKLLDLQIEELEKQISNEVWSCYQDFNTNQVAYLSSKDLLETAEENAKLNFGMYKNGRASILEVLDSQNQLKEAKLEFIKSKYNWMIYRIKLLKTIGKMSLDNIINIKEW